MKRGIRILAFGVALSLATSLPAVAGTPRIAEPRWSILESRFEAPAIRLRRSGPDSLSRLLRRGEISGAEYALERARSVFFLERLRKRHGDVRAPEPRDATRLLQDLALHLDELPPKQQREAEAILARPTDGAADRLGHGYRLRKTRVKTTCFSRADAAGKLLKICVHWAAKTRDAPPPVDANVNGQPDQVDLTIDTLVKVWDAEVGAFGYRAPLRDRGPRAGQGPNRGVDIYLVDVGKRGAYGYCTTDPLPTKKRKRDRAPAYCVLDNDFAPDQFPAPSVNGLPALQVTAAHEFFHAIQFAYEFSQEDRWLKEGTATWMEDEVYDDVNANYSYLFESALHQPEIPLDAFQGSADGEDFEYGTWVFWRFLSEYFGTRNVIREVWEESAPGPGGDKTATEALQAVVPRYPPNTAQCLLHCQAGPFRQAFSEFALWNAIYELAYDEGMGYFRDLKDQRPPSDAFEALSDSVQGLSTRTGRRELRIDHLSSRYVDLLVAASQPGATLRIAVDLPDFDRGPEATALVQFENGSFGSFRAELNSSGDGAITLQGVAQVQLMLHNSSGAFDGELYTYEAELTP